MTDARSGMDAQVVTGTLRRELGFRDLVAYGLAYIAPMAPLATLGFVWDASGGLIALAYLLGAVCMYFTARSYAEMSERFPSAGSVYGFARHSLGVFPGFVAGWMVLLDYLLIPSLVILLMSVGMGTLMPNIDRPGWICILVATSLVINWFGVLVSSRVNHIAVSGQFLSLFALIAGCTYVIYTGQGNGALTADPFFDRTAFDLDKLLNATSICILSFLGFDAISTLAEEVKSDDRRLVGRAIVTVLLACGLMSVVTTWVLGNLMPGLVIQDPAAAIFELLGARVGPWAAVAVAWIMAILVGFTNVLPMQVGVSRVLFAMARDRQLPTPLARLHPKHGTPYVALLGSTLLSFVVAMAMRNEIDVLASVVNFGALSAFFLLHVSVLVKLGIAGRSRRYIVHWAFPVLGIVVVLAVLSRMAPLALQVGIVWLAVGAGYGLYLRSRHRAELSV